MLFVVGCPPVGLVVLGLLSQSHMSAFSSRNSEGPQPGVSNCPLVSASFGVLASAIPGDLLALFWYPPSRPLTIKTTMLRFSTRCLCFRSNRIVSSAPSPFLLLLFSRTNEIVSIEKSRLSLQELLLVISTYCVVEPRI